MRTSIGTCLPRSPCRCRYDLSASEFCAVGRPSVLSPPLIVDELGPSARPSRVSLCAARTLNAAGQSRATLSPRHEQLRAVRRAAQGGNTRSELRPKLILAGAPVPPGEKGELFVAGPLLAREYLGQPTLTARPAGRTRVLISLWDSLMFGRVPEYPPEH